MSTPGANDPTVIELAESVRRGERKAVEVVDEYLGRIAEGNERLNAFVHLDADLAHASASAVDEAVARGDDPGPLAGVPFGVKDLEHCVGMPTTFGSVPFAGRGPESQDSLNVARLRAAGAVPVGKTASPEFGTLNFTKTKVFGVTRNPWDVTRTPGGSSGGSSAAVAAGIIPFATASDGGGSIRIPASFAGLVGHKASHGRIPHPEPTANQTSVSGSLTTTVADTARILDVLAGPDDRDRTSLPASGLRYEDAIESTDVRGLRARWSLDYGFAVVDPEVAEIAEAAARALAQAAGLVVDEEPIVLTDPVRAWLTTGAISMWLDIEPDMWPARRRLHAVCAPVAGADRGHHVAEVRARDPRPRAARLRLRADLRRCRHRSVSHHGRAGVCRGGPAAIGDCRRRDEDSGDVCAVHDARQPLLEPGHLGAGGPHV